MWKLSSIALTLALLSTASQASNCDTLRAQIEDKIKAAGVARFSVVVVDTAASAPGKVVGSCERGAKKIMYTQTAAPAAAPAATPATPAVPQTAKKPAAPTASAPQAAPAQAKKDAILTECKDGTVSMGGSCKK